MLKDAQYAKDFIEEMQRGGASIEAQKSMAKLVLKSGKYNHKGFKVWREHLRNLEGKTQ